MGRQLLALSGTERVVPYQPSFLAATRELVQAYQAVGSRQR